MSDDLRLPTHLWLMAEIRRLNDSGRPAYVLRKGELSGGLVLLKLALLNGEALVYSQQRTLEGELGWWCALGGKAVPEAEADAYVARATARDPDLWVVEVEDRDGRLPFPGPLV